MLSILSILLGGGYLAIILYALLLNNDGFRDYVTAFAETIIKMYKIKKMHPYSLMQIFGVILLLTSWLGIAIIILLLVDYYFNYKNKQD